MRKIFLFAFIILLLISTGFNLEVSSQGDDAKDILRKTDDLLFPNEAKFIFRMEDYENNSFKRYYLYQGCLKGNNRYLLIGMEPNFIKGTAQLRLDDSIFNYYQKIDVIKQVSAKVAFYYSTLSQEDVMGGKLSNFYNSELVAKNQETNQGINQDYYTLTITAKSKEVAYHKIVSYINANTYLPVLRKYYAFSGQQVKEMKFEDIQINNGKLILLKFTMYDSLRNGFYSKCIFSGFDYSKSIPDNYFTKIYMKVSTK